MVLTDHQWIKEDGDAPDVPLDNAVMSRLKQFKAMNQFKKVALRVSSLNISCEIIICKQRILLVSTNRSNKSPHLHVLEMDIGHCGMPIRGGDYGIEGNVQEHGCRQ